MVSVLNNEFTDADGDEITITPLPGTPERVSPNIQKQYLTADLNIELDEGDEWGPRDWDPCFPELWYFVYEKGSKRQIGEISVIYDYQSLTMSIGVVAIHDPRDYGKGYGLQMYKAVPDMMLPDGRIASEAGFVFVTEYHSPEAERVWKGLERRGMAINVGGQAYMWVTDGY